MAQQRVPPSEVSDQPAHPQFLDMPLLANIGVRTLKPVTLFKKLSLNSQLSNAFCGLWSRIPGSCNVVCPYSSHESQEQDVVVSHTAYGSKGG